MFSVLYHIAVYSTSYLFEPGFRESSKVKGLLQAVPSQVQEKERYAVVVTLSGSVLLCILWNAYDGIISFNSCRGKDRLPG